VISSYLYVLVLAVRLFIHDSSQFPDLLPLWFLPTLAIFRVLLHPCLKTAEKHLGWMAGAVALCITVFVYVHVQYIAALQPSTASPLVILLDNIVILHWSGSTVASSCCNYAMFYVLGHVVNRQRLRSILGNPFALLVAVVYLIDRRETLPYLAMLPFGLGKPLSTTFGLLAFIACAAPLADTQIECLKPLSRAAGACGKRTLYGYMVSCVLIFFLNDNKQVTGACWISCSIITDVTSFIHLAPDNTVSGLLWQIMFTSIFCSPLAEHCFSWLVSPQWLLNVLSLFWIPLRKESTKDPEGQMS
jgi:hypothetical protein